MQPQPVPVVGLNGAIGAGKSAVAHWLNQAIRIEVVDADRIGHAALLDAAVKQQLRDAFGDEVFGADGAVVRSQLAAKVFGAEAGQKERRETLESIVHPVIRREMARQIKSFRATPDLDLIFVDAAVLLESGWNDLCDMIVFVDAPFEERVQRVRGRGWDEAELRRREASQWPLDRKRRQTDVVIDNGGSLDAAGEALLAALHARFPNSFPALATAAAP